MFSEPIKRLAVTNGTDAFCSAVSMAGANAARVGIMVYNMGGASGITVTAQGSSDLCNWHDLSNSGSIGLGASTFVNTAVSDAYIRLKVSVTTGSGTAILSADIYTSAQ